MLNLKVKFQVSPRAFNLTMLIFKKLFESSLTSHQLVLV